MANKMRDVAKLLGLGIGERFKIKGVKDKIYFITLRGIYANDDSNTKNIKVPSEIIISLLMDTDKLIKLPWYPKDGEEYFTPNLVTAKDNLVSLYKNGLVCRTYEEAEELRHKLIRYACSLRGL